MRWHPDELTRKYYVKIHLIYLSYWMSYLSNKVHCEDPPLSLLTMWVTARQKRPLLPIIGDCILSPPWKTSKWKLKTLCLQNVHCFHNMVKLRNWRSVLCHGITCGYGTLWGRHVQSMIKDQWNTKLCLRLIETKCEGNCEERLCCGLLFHRSIVSALEIAELSIEVSSLYDTKQIAYNLYSKQKNKEMKVRCFLSETQ